MVFKLTFHTTVLKGNTILDCFSKMLRRFEVFLTNGAPPPKKQAHWKMYLHIWVHVFFKCICDISHLRPRCSYITHSSLLFYTHSHCCKAKQNTDATVNICKYIFLVFNLLHTTYKRLNKYCRSQACILRHASLFFFGFKLNSSGEFQCRLQVSNLIKSHSAVSEMKYIDGQTRRPLYVFILTHLIQTGNKNGWESQV
jgi:hypothetical protein